jgi:hypothetical protein
MPEDIANPKNDTPEQGSNPYWPGQGAQQPGKLPGVKRTKNADEEVDIPVVDSVPGKLH